MPHPAPSTETLDASVVIPMCNEESHIEACLSSIAAGQCIPREIVVVDDGSVDDSVSVVQCWADTSEIPVRLLQNAYVKGPSGARATGADSVAQAYIIFLDADVVLEDAGLAHFAPWVQRGEAVCGVYSATTLSTGFFARYKAMFDHYQFSRKGVTSYNRFHGYCGGCSVVAYRESGGYSRELPASCQYENEEFGARLHRRTMIHLDPAIRVVHRYPGGRRMLANYVVRVAGWVVVFREQQAFESAGDATPGNALAALLLPGALLAGLLAILMPIAGLTALVLVGLWCIYFSPFFAYAAARAPAMLPVFVVCHALVCLAITAGGLQGVLLLLRSRGS